MGSLGKIYDAPSNNQVSKMLGFVSIKNIIDASKIFPNELIDSNKDIVVHPDNIQASMLQEKTGWSLQSEIKKVFYPGPTAHVLFSVMLNKFHFDIYAQWRDEQEPVIGNNAYINIRKEDIKIV